MSVTLLFESEGLKKEIHLMLPDIEVVDQKRLKFLRWYLIGFAVFLALLLVRHFFRASGLNVQPIGGVVLAGLILSLLVQVYCVLHSADLQRQIHSEPHLEAALNNELVRDLEMRAWIAAYIGCAAATIFFAITSFFYPICDPVTISLVSIAAGAGANRACFYFRYKAL